MDEVERQAAREQLVGNDAERVDVGARVRSNRWDEKADPLAGYLSVPIDNELYWLNGGQP